MKLRSVVAAAALVAIAELASVSTAGAQAAYCMPGAPPAACFTIELLVATAPEGELPTLMTLRIRNLQGSLNSDPSLFGIDYFGVSRTATPPTDELPFGTDFLGQSPLLPLSGFGGPVEFNPAPSTSFISESSSDPDIREFTAQGVGIGGCASTLGVGDILTSTIARTCSVQGLTGAVDVSFYIGIFDATTFSASAVTADDVSITIGGHVANDFYSCTFNGATSGAVPGTTCIGVPFSTVPEPGTLALLVAPAVGLIARRRWRR